MRSVCRKPAFAVFLALFLAVPFLAYATDADDAAMAQVRAAIAMQQAANALQAAMAGLQKASPPAPVAQPTAAPAATTVAVPAALRDDLVSFAAVLIPGLIGLGLTWMRTHLRVMQDAAMNDTITKSANGFGALLVQAVQQRGGTVASLNVHSPEVASLANSLVSGYPKFTASLGITGEKAASIILKEAAKFTETAPAPAVVDPVPAAEPKPVSLASAKPIPPTPAPAADKAVAPSWPTTPTPKPA